MLNHFFPFKPGNINLSDRCREKSLSLVKLSNPPAPSPPSIQPGAQKVSPSPRPPCFWGSCSHGGCVCLEGLSETQSVVELTQIQVPPHLGSGSVGLRLWLLALGPIRLLLISPYLVGAGGGEDLIWLFFFRTRNTFCPQVGLGHQQENSYSVLGKPHRAIGPQEENHSTSCNACGQFSVSLWQGIGSGEEGQYKEDSGCCRGCLAWLTGKPLEWVLSEEKILRFLSHWHKVLQGYFSIHELCVG